MRDDVIKQRRLATQKRENARDNKTGAETFVFENAREKVRRDFLEADDIRPLTRENWLTVTSNIPTDT